MSVFLKALIDRLTPIARRAIEQAAGRALSRTHFEIEIEHVLLEVLDQDKNAALLALSALDVDVAKVERELGAALDSFRSGNTRNPGLSTWLPKWLEKAWLLASAEYGQTQISTLDLLLALLSDEALRGAIQSSSVSLARLDARQLNHAYETLRQQSGEGARAAEAAATAATTSLSTEKASASQSSSGQAALNKYTVDLTAQAHAGKIDQVLGRDAEIRQMIDILIRRRQNNPILTGEPGVGKTAVVEGLALKIIQGEVPTVLSNVTLRTLDLGLLQAGASVKGEFENRLRQVIDEVRASPAPIILFIDEAHTMIGAGGAAGQNDAANLLKPALARGELRTIAATTWAEYKKYFEKDAALARRFQVVKVEEPTPEVAVQMVRGLLPVMIAHHKVAILNEAVLAAVDLSNRYLTGRQLPDKAVSVLDTACAKVALSRTSKPGPVEDLMVLIGNIDRELAMLEREEGHDARIAELNIQRAKLQLDLEQFSQDWAVQQKWVDEISALTASQDPSQHSAEIKRKRKALHALQKNQPLAFECVDANIIADVISSWTGIPLGRMVSNELAQVQQLDRLLAERVIGQDHALQQIAERVQIAKANLDDPSKPKGVFMLVGPSGVGKTETAIALADCLYGGERNLITINMSEYQEAHSVSGLKGSPPGYIGYGEGGVLTEAVRRKPYSVVLLDEVEKAHPDVLELFFQVFDKGMLEDSEGREVDFKNTIILLTSNVGTHLVMQACEHGVKVGDAQRKPTAEDLAEILRPTLQDTFKPAFLGRLIVVPYFPISDEILRAIIDLKLEKIRKRITDNHKAILEFPRELIEKIAERCMDVDSGARNADAIINRTLLARLSGQVLDYMAQGKMVKKIKLKLKGDEIEVKIS